MPCQAVNTWLLYFSFERSKSLVKQRDSDLGGDVGVSGDDQLQSGTISLPISALNTGNPQ